MSSTIAIVLTPIARNRVLSAESLSRLATLGTVKQTEATEFSDAVVAELLSGADVLITGWGTPALAPHLGMAPGLRLIGHTAGSIRHLVPPELFDGGAKVTHAAAAIASSVADYVLAQMLMALRQGHMFDRKMKAGEGWSFGRFFPGRLLGARTVGIVGASMTGRQVIARLLPFGCRVLVQDPTLTAADAKALGVESVSLDDMLRQSDIVSLHAPKLPETDNLIGARELSLLRDGAILMNMARGSLLDEPALIAELEKGRIEAVLDVFAEEPLPTDSVLRQLENVILSPHVAGHTADGHKRQGELVVDEVERLLRGEPLQFEVTKQRLATMA